MIKKVIIFMILVSCSSKKDGITTVERTQQHVRSAEVEHYRYVTMKKGGITYTQWYLQSIRDTAQKISLIVKQDESTDSTTYFLIEFAHDRFQKNIIIPVIWNNTSTITLQQPKWLSKSAKKAGTRFLKKHQQALVKMLQEIDALSPKKQLR